MNLGSHLTGNYRVRVFKPAWADAHKWLSRKKDRVELRSHSLKLRFWPTQNPEDDEGQLLDVNWSWIRVLKDQGDRIGELRIDDCIGNCDNLRVIFYVGEPHPDGSNKMPIIWILAVLQKKRNDFTKAQTSIYRARKRLVIERFYENRLFD